MSEGYPVGEAIVAMLVGASLFPISFPLTYFLGYLGVVGWSSVAMWGFLGPMFLIGLPLVFIDLPRPLAERLTAYWLIVDATGWLTLIITMQFFNSDVPETSMNVYAMGTTLGVVILSLGIAGYLDHSEIRLNERFERLQSK